MATKTTTKKIAPKVSVSMLKTGTSTAGTSKALAPTKTAATVSPTGKVTPGMFNETQVRSPFSAQETAVSQMMNQNVTGKLPATPMPLVSNIGKQVQAVSNVSSGGSFKGSSNPAAPVNTNTYNAPAPVAPTTAPSAGMFDNAPGARSDSTPQDVQDKETTLADVARQMQKLIMSDESVKDPSIDNAMAEEELARKRLQDYQNSMLMGQQKLGEQVIPMEFITGQQRSLEARGALGEMPLQQGLENARLARSAAQAQRQAAFDTKKDKIAGLSTIANLLSSQQKSGGPITLGKDQVAIDPATGTVLYSNQSGGQTETQVIKQNGNDVLINKNTGEIIKSYAPGEDGQLGELKQNALDQARWLYENFDKGGSKQAGISSYFPTIRGSENSDYKTRLGNLTSLLELDAAKLLKGQGQITEQERALLKSAASILGPEQSDESLKNNIKRIMDTIGKVNTSSQNQMTTGQGGVNFAEQW